MPRIDFHVLSAAGVQVRHRYACRLAAATFDSGGRVFLRTASPAASQAIDELLWTFDDQSFVPHEVAGANPSTHSLVAALIGHGTVPADFRSLLINIADDIPAEAAECERIVEIVDADPARKQLARERFRRYRELGWTPESRNVD